MKSKLKKIFVYLALGGALISGATRAYAGKAEEDKVQEIKAKVEKDGEKLAADYKIFSTKGYESGAIFKKEIPDLGTVYSFPRGLAIKIGMPTKQCVFYDFNTDGDLDEILEDQKISDTKVVLSYKAASGPAFGSRLLEEAKKEAEESMKQKKPNYERQETIMMKTEENLDELASSGKKVHIEEIPSKQRKELQEMYKQVIEEITGKLIGGK